MANYIGWILTNKGRELLAKAINNETKINITKFKIGAGYNTGNDRELTDLLDKRNEFPVNSYERKENGIVEFTFIVSNKTGSGTSTITNSYKISEMGIYAQDDSGTEILYAYNKGTDGDYIPVYNGKNAIDIVEKCIIIIDQAATLNVTIDNSMTYLTRDSADRRYLEIQALSKIIGMEFGGNIQDVGNKTKGKFYYDNVTKFYYECIADTNLTYNDVTKFRAISNKPLSDKVEGLLEVGNNYLKFSNGIVLGFGTCIASPSGTMNNYGINMGGITSLMLTVNGGTFVATGETTSGTTFKARTNAPGEVSASYLAIGKWK
ncbi:phage tail-collar fiber domain-containing protein [Leptotrichia hongkongensis]|uniref:phage tail-collar fiber domain-containing protein n=1 Tax=Leptotrichia hongkongensis TaxID=554406 RepID=UPI0035A8C952